MGEMRVTGPIHPPVLDMFRKTGVAGTVGEDMMFEEVEEAVRALEG